ncbi:GNAT family N-acetyltransferase [Marinospirillum sp.]|uniref:GNAT family N-acetyltransferase n=1 Tax=Marinospirillum sp. TaxID=2183934 RepID=UPI00384F90E6
MQDLPERSWQQLVGQAYPFLRYEFLQALEETGCVSLATGWQPCHAAVWEGDRLVAVLPGYRKYHSRGEYVFDFQWAEAYRHFPDPETGIMGRDYYPKLLSAIPFTPAGGPRLVMAEDARPEEVLACLADAIQVLLAEQSATGERLSGWHLLFPDTDQTALVSKHWPTPLLQRHGCQFHWLNRDYADFEAFLAAMTSKRRKEVRRERRKVADQGLSLQRFKGKDITPEMMSQFYTFYQMTYHLRGQRPYLTQSFFLQLLETMGDALMLVMAWHQGRAVAGALFFVGEKTLYGRYWGALVEADCLHFEACYYQGIEFAIAEGLQRFDPGTQGEHKISRGFEPVLTHSLHWLHDERFSRAVDDFLQRERAAVADYREQASQLLPFRSNAPG